MNTKFTKITSPNQSVHILKERLRQKSLLSGEFIRDLQCYGGLKHEKITSLRACVLSRGLLEGKDI